MKIRTTRYIIKDGILNTIRNKLMSLASISIVTASLIIFGIFFLISVNLNSNTKALKEQPQMQIFCYPESDDSIVAKVEEKLSENSKIQSYTKVTKQEAFEKVKKLLGDNQSVLEGMDESFLAVSFIIKVKNPEESAAIVKELEKIDGVKNVRYKQDVVEFISRITNWVNIISASLVVILLIFSVSIIANTIKLTVFARRKEISIMKYMGATDWFIRWPFIVEGIIIGIFGAIIAFVITGLGYNAVEGKFNGSMTGMSNFINIVKINGIWLQLIASYAFIGCVVGAAGSAISLRKYLHV